MTGFTLFLFLIGLVIMIIFIWGAIAQIQTYHLLRDLSVEIYKHLGIKPDGQEDETKE